MIGRTFGTCSTTDSQGRTVRHGQSSLPLIAARLPATLQLTVTAMLFAIVLAVPLGVVAAANRGRPVDFVAMAVGLLGQSVPNFWLAIMMILLFSVSWGLLPTSGRGGPAHVVMPAVAIAIIFSTSAGFDMSAPL